MQWYCWIEGQQYGPAHLDDLRGWIEEERLHPEDHVWSEGMAEWTTAGNIPELFPPAAGSAAPPQAALPALAVPPLAQPQATYPGKGMCVGGMVLGIISIVAACCSGCTYGVPGMMCGLVGLILSIVGIRQAKRANAPCGMGTAGVILSIIGIVLGLVMFVFMAIALVHRPSSEFGGLDFDVP